MAVSLPDGSPIVQTFEEVERCGPSAITSELLERKMGLLEIVWRNFQLLAVESPLAQGLAEFSEVRKLGMNWRWEERGGWWMCTASPHFVRGRQYEGWNATAISPSRPSSPWAKRSHTLSSSRKSSIAAMKALPPVAAYARTCAAPIHTSTGPA
jgi:hypothetical protein